MPTTRRSSAGHAAFEPLRNPRKLTAADKKRIIKAAGAEVDAFLIGAGIKEPSRLADRRGGRYLPFEKTPAYVCVEELEGDLYVRVEAKVMEMPSDRDEVFGLMARLLEIDGTVAGVCRLAMDDGLVIAAGAENMRALHAPEQLIQHIEMVIEFAESAQKELVRRPRRARATRPHRH